MNEVIVRLYFVLHVNLNVLFATLQFYARIVCENVVCDDDFQTCLKCLKHSCSECALSCTECNDDVCRYCKLCTLQRVGECDVCQPRCKYEIFHFLPFSLNALLQKIKEKSYGFYFLPFKISYHPTYLFSFLKCCGVNFFYLFLPCSICLLKICKSVCTVGLFKSTKGHFFVCHL